MASRIKPTIPFTSKHDKGDSFHPLTSLPPGLEFGGLEVSRRACSYGDALAGGVGWIWIEYIGDRAALLKMPGLLPRFFDVNKSGHRRHRDDSGHSVFVDRYKDDRWKMRVDARDLADQSAVDACVSTYWPEPLTIPFMDPAAEAVAKATNCILEEIEASPEFAREQGSDAYLALLAEFKTLARRPAAREALDVAIGRKLGLTATLKLMRRSHLRLVVSK